MNKYLFLITGILLFIGQKVFCMAETVSPEIEQSLKVHSNEPGFMSILFALLIVVALIYITGLIYSKLNLVGTKTIQNQLKNYDLSKVIVLSTTQLGQNKNLHVIEINKKRYLIGATQNTINLIKELDPITEKEKSIEPTFDDAIDVLYGKEDETVQLNLENVKEFDVHKKYL